jgi:hypothetical protein
VSRGGVFVAAELALRALTERTVNDEVRPLWNLVEPLRNQNN